jgi:hypothetical protein
LPGWPSTTGRAATQKADALLQVNQCGDHDQNNDHDLQSADGAETPRSCLTHAMNLPLEFQNLDRGATCVQTRDPFANNRTYAVPHTNAFLPAAAWYLPFYLCFLFALCERKKETQKNAKDHI